VVFSTGNVYPFVNAASGGSVETDAPQPHGEYASSCLGRERLIEVWLDFHPDWVLIGGTWPGELTRGTVFARHIYTTTNGVIT